VETVVEIRYERLHAGSVSEVRVCQHPEIERERLDRVTDPRHPRLRKRMRDAVSALRPRRTVVGMLQGPSPTRRGLDQRENIFQYVVHLNHASHPNYLALGVESGVVAMSEDSSRPIRAWGCRFGYPVD